MQQKTKEEKEELVQLYKQKRHEYNSLPDSPSTKFCEPWEYFQIADI